MQEPGAHEGVRRPERSLILLGVFIVLTILGTAGFSIWHDRRSTFDERHRDMKRTALILAEQTGRYLAVIDLITLDVKAKVDSMNITTAADFSGRLGTLAVKAYLSERITNLPQAEAVSLIDANGITLNSSLSGTVLHADVSGYDYYTYFKDNNDQSVLIESLASGLVTGKGSLHLARRISTSTGEFLGLVVGAVDIRYISDSYRAAVANRGEAVTLLRRDGTVLLRYPTPQLGIGVNLPQGSPSYQRIEEGSGSDFAPANVPDDSRGLVSAHPLPDYPLVLDIVIDEAIALAGWRSGAAYVMSCAFLAALAFSGLFWILVSQFRRKAQQNTRLIEAAISLSEGQRTLRTFAEMSVDWFWEQNADFRSESNTTDPLRAAFNDVGKTRWELADPAMSEERWTTHKADLVARRLFRNFRWERIGEDGRSQFLSTSGNPVFDRKGTFAGYRGTEREITTEVKASGELEIERQQFRMVLENMRQGISFFGIDQRLIICNRRYGEIYRLSEDQTRVGTSLAEILAHRLTNGTLQDISVAEFLARREEFSRIGRPYDLVDKIADGRTIAMHYQPLPMGGWLTTHEDMTERCRAEEQLVFMAQHDALTRLPNRAMFQARLEDAIEMTGRGSACAVLCLNLDRFKLVNDTLGHIIGDGLLRTAADRLQACVGEGDTVARLGGDEFAIIRLSAQRPEDVELLANRIIAAFGVAFEIDGQSVIVGISIGVAVAPGDATSPGKLLKLADIALYLAKTDGRSSVRFFEPEMDASIHRRRMLEVDLQGAAARNEFELYYQPLIRLRDDKITGFEALIRWHHPVHGLVSPNEFIPIAEETGMIIELGQWVLGTACFEAQTWPENIGVAVNLSPVQFTSGNLINAVEGALVASGLRPSRLELEITESVLIQDVAGTLELLHQLRAMGIAIALDDFGTGYSSLSYLRSFPFDKIKIDQSFVHDLVENKDAMAIIRAVTGLGHSLRMETTAEGVETQEQLDKLRDEGCTDVQGYFFSIPRPAKDLPAFMRDWQRGGQSGTLLTPTL